MKFELMPYIYSKSVYAFIEFDLKELKMDWENPYSIMFDRYNNKDYCLLSDTLHSIKIDRPFTTDEIERRLESGHMLFIAKRNDKIIGFFWVARNHIDVPYFHASICLSKEEVIDYNNYVVEEYRGKSVLAGLKAYAFHNLKQQGYKRAFCYVKTTNQSALRANKHFGFHSIGEITAKIMLTLEFRRSNLLTPKIVFHGGMLRLWKGLFRKIREIFRNKKEFALISHKNKNILNH